MQPNLSISSLSSAYANGSASPSQIIARIYPLLEQEQGSFIALAPQADLLRRCRELEQLIPQKRGSLWGVPFAVKDNIDVEGFNTTAGCSAFSHAPQKTAPAVQVLLDEGGVMVGKTNMDQFAAGLVGTRTPFGTARNAFDDRFVPGGSSSGSGAVVGSGLVSFALGTDTAGSGRVPAMLNGCVGIKPTVRRVTSQGLVPACRSLDCISCFACTVEDGVKVIKLMEKAGCLEDSSWRPPPSMGPARPQENGVHEGSKSSALFCNPKFRFGVPSAKFLQFEGPGGQATALMYSKAFQAAIERMASLNGEIIDVDFSPFCEIAQLLYNSAFVAERYAGIRSFIDHKDDATSRQSIEKDPRMEKVTAAIVASGADYSAADVYEAFARMSVLAAKARVEMSKVDMLLVPTVLQNYLIAEVEAEEKQSSPPTWTKNTLSGRFTNFVNLLDMAAISVPSAILQSPDLSAEAADTDDEELSRRAKILKETGNSRPYLPFGVTLIGPAWTDEFLWEIGAKYHAKSGLECGPAGHNVPAYRSR